MFFLVPVLAALAFLALRASAARADAVDDEIARIQAHIRAHGYSWTAGRTSMMELSPEERRARLGLRLPPGATGVLSPEDRDSRPPAGLFPSYFNWMDQGVVIPVRDQGGCGSCWAFSAVGTLECRIRIVTGVVQDLSEQQLISCSGDGCAGGQPTSAFEYIRHHGIVSEACMPYQADDEVSCTQDECEVEDTIQGWYWVGEDVASIKAALAEGPVSTSMTVQSDFAGYTGGCYEHDGQFPVNHAVVIMGWDDNACDGQGAWFCRNSWGRGFGLDGYFWIKYGSSSIGVGSCQIQYSPLHPVVLTHVPLIETDDNEHDYQVQTDAVSYVAPPIVSALVTYRINGGIDHEIPMTHRAGNTWEGAIPHQPTGTIIDYALSATDGRGNQGFHPRNGGRHTFRIVNFLVHDACESPGDWTAGVEGDDAVTGSWENGDPKGTYFDGLPVQCEDDASPDPGTRCFVTGVATGGCYSCNDVSGGTTTLLSPTYDMAGLNDATLSFQLWYVNRVGIDPIDDSLRIDVSNDEGASWSGLAMIPRGGPQWNRMSYQLENVLPLTSQMKLRFRASDTGRPSVVEAAVDELEISTLFLPAGVADPPARPQVVLMPPVPNPSGERCRIDYVLPTEGPVSLDLYTVDGRREKALVHEVQSAGPHSLTLDSDGIASGIYWLRLATVAGMRRERMVLVSGAGF